MSKGRQSSRCDLRGEERWRRGEGLELRGEEERIGGRRRGAEEDGGKEKERMAEERRGKERRRWRSGGGEGKRRGWEEGRRGGREEEKWRLERKRGGEEGRKRKGGEEERWRGSPVCNFNPAHKTCYPRFLDVNRFIRTLTTKVTRVHITISGAFSRI